MQAKSIEKLLQQPIAAIMGIVNVTPDSFSDGGRYLLAQDALKQGLKLVDEGANILDIGAESTRPGAQPVSLQEELDRVLPVVELLVAETPTPISIDTTKPEVMAGALNIGAHMINDVNALQAQGAVEVVAKHQVPVCLMHMQGSPQTMQQTTAYIDVVSEVIAFLQQRIEVCLQHGLDKANIIVDPGIGFGKNLEHNLSLLKHVAHLISETQCDVLIGVSRKSLIEKMLNREVDQRLPASIGLAVQSMLNGAKILRVHDVQATHDAVRSVEAVMHAS